MSSDPVFWRTLTLVLAAFGQTLFALFYLFWPWWNDFLGRALFFKALALCLVMDVGLLARVIELPHEDWVFVGLYVMFTLGVWGQFIAFTRVYLRGGMPRDHHDA